MNMSEIKIVIDNEKLNKYREYYFDKYPRRKKFPIDKPFPPSLNRFIAMKRMMQNSTKQKWKEFSMWLASYYEIANMNLNKVEIEFSFYFADHRRRDFDNLMMSPKFIMDGFVYAKVLEDDDGEKLRIYFDAFHYDKENPRIEMNLKYKIEGE